MSNLFEKLQGIITRERDSMGNNGDEPAQVLPEDGLSLAELEALQMAWAWFDKIVPEWRLEAAQAVLTGLLSGCTAWPPVDERRPARVAFAVAEADALLDELHRTSVIKPVTQP